MLPDWLEQALQANRAPVEDAPPTKPRRKQASPLSDRVGELLAQHPGWTCAQLAEAASCSEVLARKGRRQLRHQRSA
jgi:hypothetical protein